MSRAWREGAAVVVLAHLSWFGLIVLGSHSGWFMGAIVVMFFLVMNIAGLAAFVTALRSPDRQWMRAMSMAPLTALLATLSNFLFEAIGVPVDFSGFHGTAGLFAVSLAYGIFVSAVGAGIGIWVSRRQQALQHPAGDPGAHDAV